MPICILCTSVTKTKEHIFPAAMGGRRENSKIYCAHHNNKLGELVPILQKQMAMANALIAVRGDRDKRPKAFAFDAPDGKLFEMLNGDFNVRLPNTTEDLPVQANGTRIIKTASDEQFASWAKDQEKTGWKISISGSEQVETKYYTSPLHISQNFGGKDFLRAVAYLGLTFFAVYFGNEARQDGLQDFKEFVTTAAEPGQNVWWDGRDVEKSVGPNKYLFGHTIVVGVSQASGRGYGLISFFSALTFGLDFGPVSAKEDVEYVVNIDPKAEWAQPGVDVFDAKNEVPRVIVKFAPSDLKNMVNNGSAAVAFGRFLGRASEWRLTQDASQFMETLKTFQAVEASKRLEHISDAMISKKQRVLNLLNAAIENIQNNLAIGEMAFLFAYTEKLIVADESTSDGLARHSSEYVDLAAEQIAREIDDSLSCGHLTIDSLSMLIGGGLGLELITRRILIPAIAQALIAAHDPRGAILLAAFPAEG